MPAQLEVLLLLALPASGKSEVRRYLDHLDPAIARRDMALGPTVQLDDYPYVHLMRRISEELQGSGADPVFFADSQSAWREPRDWLTLIHLLNGDFVAITTGDVPATTPGTLLDRIDAARDLAGATQPFATMRHDVRERLEASLAPDIAAVDPLERAGTGTTIVIEFARGGPAGAGLPLPHPLGYAASLAALSDSILSRASVLYVWVDPAESRWRNRERAIAGRAGDASILHHGVPERVMIDDYGLDDMEWLQAQGRHPGTIPIRDHDIPMQRFDNRIDRTSFLRSDPATWPPSAVEDLHRGLSDALSTLAAHQPGPSQDPSNRPK